MKPEEIKSLLNEVKENKMDIDQAMAKLKSLPFTDLGYAKIDNHRELRTGYPEVVFAAGKTVEQVKGIVNHLLEKEVNILVTRATKEMFEAVKVMHSDISYNELARTITLKHHEINKPDSYISIVTAGTSDIPVAEEAAITAEVFGNNIRRFFDVGVAGIHRLYDKYQEINGGRVIVVIAGMEGALPSIVGGMVDKPVIAVPTSIGYGANFNGLSALLGMLTSCASGVSVVNIDNGFGAGYLASMINKL